MPRAESVYDLKAIEVRHFQIEQNQVGALYQRHLQTLGAVSCLHRDKALPSREGIDDKVPDGLAVVYYQNTHISHFVLL